MTSTSDAPGSEDIFEARGHDELVVEEFFDAATDDEDSDVVEYSTGDEIDGGADDTHDDALDMLTMTMTSSPTLNHLQGSCQCLHFSQNNLTK